MKKCLFSCIRWRTVWCKTQRREEPKRLSYFLHSTIWVSSETLKQTHIFISRNCIKLIKCMNAYLSVWNGTYPKWYAFCWVEGFIGFLFSWSGREFISIVFWVVEYASWEGTEPRNKGHVNYLTLLVLGVLLDYGQHLSKSVAIIHWKGIHEHQWLILM